MVCVPESSSSTVIGEERHEPVTGLFGVVLPPTLSPLLRSSLPPGLSGSFAKLLETLQDPDQVNCLRSFVSQASLPDFACFLQRLACRSRAFSFLSFTLIFSGALCFRVDAPVTVAFRFLPGLIFLPVSNVVLYSMRASLDLRFRNATLKSVVPSYSALRLLFA